MSMWLRASATVSTNTVWAEIPHGACYAVWSAPRGGIGSLKKLQCRLCFDLPSASFTKGEIKFLNHPLTNLKVTHALHRLGRWKARVPFPFNDSLTLFVFARSYPVALQAEVNYVKSEL